MSKQSFNPKDQKSASGLQFNSGLDQSLQNLALDADVERKARQPGADVPSASSRRWQIPYHELKFGASKGNGAYGEVFEGDYRRSKVAIKVYDFRGQLPEKQKAEILHEADLMESLRSEYLVGFRGMCFDPRYCLVMEYCDGGTLRARLDKNEEVALPEQLRWAMQISYGVYQLHSVKIIHRDLKGENILLDGQSHAKVADFGLSVVKSSSASQSKKGGNVAGTLPWMAPELFEEEPQRAASDIYSLGMVLWEMMSRRRPFANVIPAIKIAVMVSSGKREMIDGSWPLIFRTLMQACWDADPAKRPTAEQVGDECAAALKSLEAVPKVVSKSAAELELEQLREQLRQSELEKQRTELEKKREMEKLREENEKLKRQQAVAVVIPRLDRGIQSDSQESWMPRSSRGMTGNVPAAGSPVLPAALPVLPAGQNPASFLPPPPKPIVSPVVDAKALAQLLQFVVEGEQDKAEAMIKQNPQLLLAAGEVKDLSGRTFKNVTAFQYALWAMDYHMWTMIKQYLPLEAQAKQFTELETKGTEHGKHYDIKPLTEALQTYVDNAAQWNYDQRAADQWNKKVGGAQKLVPAHVVNEYTRSDRPFHPCPSDWELKLPRTREIEVWDGSQYVKGSWFRAPNSKDSLGESFAFYRYNDKVGARGRRCVGSGLRRGWRCLTSKLSNPCGKRARSSWSCSSPN